jgi:hypothetical protein
MMKMGYVRYAITVISVMCLMLANIIICFSLVLAVGVVWGRILRVC